MVDLSPNIVGQKMHPFLFCGVACRLSLKLTAGDGFALHELDRVVLMFIIFDLLTPDLLFCKFGREYAANG